MNDLYSLDTPESVAVAYPIAGVGSRFLAILIDSLVQIIISIAIAIVIYVAYNALGSGSVASYVALALGVIGAFCVLLGYYILFEIVWNGQTPGKRAMRLRVIQTSGYPVTPFAVLIRNVLRLIDFLPAYYAAGVLCMFINKQSRRLGDLAAGTMVIKEGREGNLASLPAPPSSVYRAPNAPALAYPAQPGAYAPPASPQAGSFGTLPPTVPLTQAAGGYAAPDAQPGGLGPYGGDSGATPNGAAFVRLSREDEVLVRDFLNRRWSLAPQRRDQLGRQIAAVVHGHIGGAPPQAPEPYLEQVLIAHDAGR